MTTVAGGCICPNGPPPNGPPPNGPPRLVRSGLSGGSAAAAWLGRPHVSRGLAGRRRSAAPSAGGTKTERRPLELCELSRRPELLEGDGLPIQLELNVGATRFERIIRGLVVPLGGERSFCRADLDRVHRLARLRGNLHRPRLKLLGNRLATRADELPRAVHRAGRTRLSIVQVVGHQGFDAIDRFEQLVFFPDVLQGSRCMVWR